jgi:anaerobic selenocysteine-containing dehydrogenase
MRRHGAFEIRRGIGSVHAEQVPATELDDVATDALGRAFTRAPRPAPENLVPVPTPDGDAAGRRLAGISVDGEIVRGFPTPSGRLELWSRTLAEWGWPEYALPAYIESHVHPRALAADQMVLIPTFRIPVQIHTRSGNAKWLDELAHTNPLWLNPRDAARIDVATGELVRVETEIGYFVLKAWVTEGIRPGVVACSHHMGRWKLPTGDGQRQIMATVSLERDGRRWTMRRSRGVAPYASSDPDTRRIWWSDAGVHQNLTFPVHPDPISGMHCWHQAVRVRRAEPGDRHADIFVDTEKSRAAYRAWLARTRPATAVSPDGTRRPYWLLRPLKPAREVYTLPRALPRREPG